MIIDTHTHLYSDEFSSDRKEVILRALQSGVKRFYLPSIDSSDTKKMLDLKEEFPSEMFLMNGLHPCSVKENYKEELFFVEELHKKYDFVAIGEIGIDLYWDKSFLKEQQEAFLYQIKMAKREKLPISIHCREAFDEVFEILFQEKSSELWGIFHCFTGTKQEALKAISCGMKLGIGGVVTYKNGKIDSFLKEIPLENLVLETDAPYLSPVPYRGKRNEPSYISEIIKKLSQIYDISEEEISEITTQNALKVFGS